MSIFWSAWLTDPAQKCKSWAHDLCCAVGEVRHWRHRLLLLLLDDLTTQFWKGRKLASMWTASNTELNPEKRDLLQDDSGSNTAKIDWRISTLRTGSGRMWALLLLAISLVTSAAGLVIFIWPFSRVSLIYLMVVLLYLQHNRWTRECSYNFSFAESEADPDYFTIFIHSLPIDQDP